MKESKSKCIFCDYDPSTVIQETSLVVAIYFPRAIKKGHFAVAVKRHVSTFCDIREDEVFEIMSMGFRIARKAQRQFGAEKYYMVAIGDKDPHFHIHMLPKLPGDVPMGKHIMSESGWMGEVGQIVPKEEVSDFVRVLRDALSE